MDELLHSKLHVCIQPSMTLAKDPAKFLDDGARNENFVGSLTSVMPNDAIKVPLRIREHRYVDIGIEDDSKSAVFASWLSFPHG